MMPDYSNYNLDELYDSLNHIDEERYPERTKHIQNEILSRRSSLEKEISIDSTFRSSIEQNLNEFNVNNLFHDIRILVGLFFVLLGTIAFLFQLEFLLSGFFFLGAIMFSVSYYYHDKNKIRKIRIENGTIIFIRKNNDIKINVTDLYKIRTSSWDIKFEGKEFLVKVFYKISDLDKMINELLKMKSNLEIGKILQFRLKHNLT